MGIQEAALSGGLYTRLVLHDFLPEYPGRAPFVPGLSEYGATKPWAGSPMAAIQRAVIMMRKLNLSGIPCDIVKNLRALQDIYSETIDLDEVSDSDGETDAELGEDGEKNRQAETERLQESDSKNIPSVDECGTEDNRDKAQGPSSTLRTQSSYFWRWGPSATSQDAVRFFRAVI